jgi:hypothetical protein
VPCLVTVLLACPNGAHSNTVGGLTPDVFVLSTRRLRAAEAAPPTGMTGAVARPDHRAHCPKRSLFRPESLSTFTHADNHSPSQGGMRSTERQRVWMTHFQLSAGLLCHHTATARSATSKNSYRTATLEVGYVVIENRQASFSI